MPRFYCPPPVPPGGLFELPQHAAHHAARVLRLREEDHVEIFDSSGSEYHGVIAEIGGKRVMVNITGTTRISRESPLRITLAQAMSSSEKMDWIIQKSTELGVAEIQPIDTERSVARLSAERATKRLEHWQQVAISACEQCRRNVLPAIHAPQDIMAWLQQVKASPDTKLILLPDGSAALNRHPRPDGHVILLIGAEGGFTRPESESALQCGFTAIRMGSRVLRTETAALAGLAALQTLWGDFQDLA